ncbi:MAG: hybrid sensor histidine kinase/response regulator [Leptospiraceae bacterium]|nr:hybrid sensor histidine kinase/response regulator [Leptospiraceae bacterium]
MEQEPIILVVDDVLRNIQLIGNMLKSSGYRINYATDGQSAIENALKNPYDLILLDIMMPKLSGFDVCEKLKENPITKEIPIIFLTAKTDMESVTKGFQIGGVDYITKPFNQEELIVRVKTHINLQKQNKKLKELNAMKDKFFSIIAHDLKNPFHSILGLSEILAARAEHYDTNRIKELASFIHSSTKSGYDLLLNLLEWARSQTNSIKFQPENYALNDFIQKIIDFFTSNAEEKNIQIIKQIPENASIFGDLNMLNTVIQNLVTNAIKFTHTNGKVTISANTTENFTTLAIADTGIGMSEENKNKLFRIDEHYIQPGTNGESGTGLGLIICKEFVEKHEGKIWVESELDRGSCFFITIPASKPS